MERLGSGDYLENYLKPEHQRAMARQINGLQTDIIHYIQRNGLSIQSNEEEGWESDIIDNSLRIEMTDKMMGAEVMNMRVVHSNYKTRTRELTGVRTNDMLFIAMYPDKMTKEQVGVVEKFGTVPSLSTLDSMVELEKKLRNVRYEKDKLNRFFDWGTIYLTDKKGKFAKLGIIPDYLSRGRNNIQIFDEEIEGSTIVEYPMQLRDFSIAREVLLRLTETITGSKGHKSSSQQDNFDINNPNF